MTDYTKFDAALLAEIARDPQDFLSLTMTRHLGSLAESLGIRNRFGERVLLDRIFDLRLQALRRAGKIRYTGKVWEADHGKA